MFKIFVIIIIAVGIFFWYPTSGDPIKKEILSPTTQHSVQLPPAEHSKATVFLLSILPPKQTWPDPIQKIWLSLNIEEAVLSQISLLKCSKPYWPLKITIFTIMAP